jgi:2'-5' RNA ligase
VTWRLFVAIDLPDGPRRALTALCDGVSGARWMPPEQMHLTLRFLGATPEEAVSDLRARLGRVRQAPFAIAGAGVGVFPPPAARKPARVLWAAVAPPGPVVALKDAIDAQLGPDPETAERGFHPHVTLARFRDRPGRELGPYLAAHAAFATPPFTVDAFHLYRSTLGSDGARHERVASYGL